MFFFMLYVFVLPPARPPTLLLNSRLLACAGGGAQAPPGRIAGRLGAPAGTAGGKGMPGLWLRQCARRVEGWKFRLKFRL